MRRLAALVLVAVLLAACGTKGPLYLPTPGGSPEDQKQKR